VHGDKGESRRNHKLHSSRVRRVADNDGVSRLSFLWWQYRLWPSDLGALLLEHQQDNIFLADF
jgi:hypothetical protein